MVDLCTCKYFLFLEWYWEICKNNLIKTNLRNPGILINLIEVFYNITLSLTHTHTQTYKYAAIIVSL